MEHQKLASLKDDDDGGKPNKTAAAGTTKGGVQKLKFTPTVPSSRRPKTEAAPEPAAPQAPAPRQRVPRPKPTGGLMSTISDQPATGTFAHGFGTFGKAARAGTGATGSIAGISRVKSDGKPTSTSCADEYHGGESIGIENAIDSSDPLSPVSVHNNTGSVAPHGITVNTPISLQLPGLHGLLDYGIEEEQRTKKPSSLLAKSESEKIIDMEAFNQINNAEKDSKNASWPADRTDRIGDVRIHKSGKVTIAIGPYTFNAMQINNASTASLWAIDKDYGHIFDIGSIEEHFVASMKFVE